MSGHLCGCDVDAKWQCEAYPDCAGGAVLRAEAELGFRVTEVHADGTESPFNPPQVTVVHSKMCRCIECMVADSNDSLMAEAWDLTTRDRHNQYGSAEDAFRAYGHIWTGLLAHKLQPDAVIDASDVCLMMAGLKLAREVRNSKRDNVVDAHGYLSLLSRIRGWVNRR